MKNFVYKNYKMSYYKILGLKKDASYDQIKQKYKKLALKYHPDRSRDPKANEKFRLISEAYQTLSDPYSRGKYDAIHEEDYYHNIFPKFGIRLPKAFKMFDQFFKNDPFKILMPKDGTNYQSYSSSIVRHFDKDGKMRTERNVKINRNGKHDSYYDEYYTDKDGHKHLIKKHGNSGLIERKKRHAIKYNK